MKNAGKCDIIIKSIIIADRFTYFTNFKLAEVIMEITKDIRYVGVNDREIDLFEGQFEVENGMAYNSYVISDD